MVAKDLRRLSKILAPRTTGLHQEAEGLAFSAKGLREEPKDLHRKSDDVSSLAEDRCPLPKVLLQKTTVLFLGNKGQSVTSKCGASRSKRLSHASAALRPDSESLFVEPE
jgi:hypothetical protein